MPSEQLLADMQTYNEELVKAGVMLAGEGLHPSSKGKRVKFAGGRATVIDGPFTEAKELIAGFWLWQVKFIEIRQVFDDDDFGEEFTPELREKEQQLRAQVEAYTKS